MREVDDQALRSRPVLGQLCKRLLDIRELKIPLADGVITRNMCGQIIISRMISNAADDEITLFKNRGAHLDLMTADYILQQWKRCNDPVLILARHLWPLH